MRLKISHLYEPCCDGQLEYVKEMVSMLFEKVNEIIDVINKNLEENEVTVDINKSYLDFCDHALRMSKEINEYNKKIQEEYQKKVKELKK